MKPGFLILFTFHLLTAAAQPPTAAERSYDSAMAVLRACTGRAFPSFEAIGLDGQRWSKQQLAGKTVLVNFWFTGCKPCIAEFAWLNQLYNRYRRRSNWLLLSFTFDGKATATNTARQHGLRFPVLMVSDSTIRQLNCGNGFPTNLIINPKGQIHFVKAGGFLNAAAFDTAVVQPLRLLLQNNKKRN